MRGRKAYEERTRRELGRQLEALGARQFEFGILGADMARRVWTAADAMRAVGWLSYRNTRGAHVYTRPAGTGTVLVDDLTASALEAAAADGVAPAAVVETSPDNYQAWIRFPDQLGRDVASCAGRVLAKRYGGDPASIDFRHLGRAAGFTNRKAEHRDEEGRYPWVRVVGAEGGVTPNADELRAEAEELFAAMEAERAARAAGVNGAARRSAGSGRSAAEAFEREVQKVRRRYGGSTDMSRADAAAAKRLARDGFGESEVAYAIAVSGSVQKRKRGHVEDYAQRTAAWAFGRTRRRRR